MTWAAQLEHLGLPGWELLHSSDETERMVASAVAEKLAEYKDHERTALAVEIIDKLAEAVNKK